MTDQPKKRPKREVSAKERERLTSPEQKAHLREIGFQKGHAKVGGRKKLPEEIRNALMDFSMEAIEVLKDVALNSSNDNARRQAAAYFIDPFVPKAPTNVQVEHKHDIAGMLAQINQARLTESKPVLPAPTIIDITPVATEDAPKLRITPVRTEDHD